MFKGLGSISSLLPMIRYPGGSPPIMESIPIENSVPGPGPTFARPEFKLPGLRPQVEPRPISTMPINNQINNHNQIPQQIGKPNAMARSQSQVHNSGFNRIRLRGVGGIRNSY